MISSDLVLLLLPVAAASGWWAANRSARRHNGAGGYETNPAYFRGLNYLLNEEPDKAIDVFVELLEVDSDTVETHLALGNLFRRRGEVERAIRIHQNLIARPALTRQQRAYALFELGQDYMRAGLYDRAENLFKELVDMKLHRRKALSNLRMIYEKEKDWNACLQIADKLEPLAEKSLAMEKSHYYCELALKAIEQGQTVEAKKDLETAQAIHSNCIRALQLQADLAIQEDQYSIAINLLTQAAEKSPAYLPELLPALIRCHKHQGSEKKLRDYLEALIAKQPHSGVIPYLVDIMCEQEGEAATVTYLSEHIQRYPTLSGLMRLIELNTNLPDVPAGEILQGLRQHMQTLLAERPEYQCSHCGYVAATMHWQCPGCSSWSTIKHQPEVEEITS